MADTSIRVDETAALGVALAHARQLADGLAILLRQAIADRDVAEQSAVELEQRLHAVAGDEPLAEWEQELRDATLIDQARQYGDDLGQAGRDAAIASAIRVLGDHYWLGDGADDCHCGWKGPAGRHHRHVAEQLWAVGLLTDSVAARTAARQQPVVEAAQKLVQWWDANDRVVGCGTPQAALVAAVRIHAGVQS